MVPDAGLFYLAVVESPTIPKLERRAVPGTEYFSTRDPAEIYASNCAECHGVAGEGQPPLYPAINALSERLTDEAFATLVKQGRGRMSGFPDLREEQIAALAQYVDALGDARLTGHALTTGFDASDSTDSSGTNEQWQYQSGYHHFFTDTGLLGPPPWSKLVAYDLNKGVILWQKPYGDVLQLARKGITGTGSLFPTNSLTATAGGLLFSTTNDRRIRAWDRDTGEVLWSAQLPADPGGIPAVYELDGRQYVIASATRSNQTEDGIEVGARAYIAFSLPDDG